MINHVNLMTDAAQFRAVARVRVRCWIAAWGVLVMLLLPLGASRWRTHRDVMQQHEALEAAYEPTRKLAQEIRTLRTEAKTMVEKQRIELELARVGSPAVLLGIASQAAKASQGEIYARQIDVTQYLPGGATAEGRGRMVIKAAGTLPYDVTHFVDALDQAPFAGVSVLATEAVNQDGIDQKDYTVECLY